NVAVLDPLGSIGSTPAFSPKFQGNLRARYEWSAAEYRWFAMAGINHVGEMANQPSSFPSGDGVLVPTTTWLRYTMPAYNTYDASLGFSKDQWEASVYGQNLSNSNASTFTTSGQDIKAIVPLRPRVLGVKVAIRF
ncbi:MAG: TonB-dependent receptor, partial [Gammaproteobacteria bacterium]|nr:TonB-dependent receptor [Gammaproteobacteria bacterium]